MVQEHFDISRDLEFLDWRELRKYVREAGGGNIYPVPEGSDDVFPENNNPLCQRIIGNQQGLSRCIAIHRLQLRGIRETLRPVIFRCHAGFWNIAIPVHNHGEYLGAVMGCGILDHTRQKIDYRMLAQELKMNYEELQEDLRKVPLLTKSKLKALQSMLSMMMQSMISTRMSKDETDQKLNQYRDLLLHANTLYKIFKIFRTSQDFTILQHGLVNVICQETNSDAAFLYLFDEEFHLILTGTTSGFDDKVGTISLETKVLNDVINSDDMVNRAGFPLPTEMTAGKNITPCKGMDGFTSRMFYPMISNTILIGCMELVSHKAGHYVMSVRKDDFIRTLTNQSSVALENALLRNKLELLSVTDEMTGLHNFRFFSDKLSEEISRCARYGHTLSLIMIDLDHFKDFNDTFGHPEGDNALRILAKIMNENIRDVDMAARYGGEEFVIILPETGLDETKMIIERICREVEQYNFVNREHEKYRKLTISAGIATFPHDAQEMGPLIDYADKALYSSKAKGGNIVTCFHDISMTDHEMTKRTRITMNSKRKT